MKKGFVLVLLFALLVPSVFSAFETKIYNGWVLAGTPFKINNETFRANYIKESNTTIIYFPEGLSAVIKGNSNDTCTQEWLYSICETKQKFEKDGKEIPPDAHELNIDVSLFLVINKTDAGLFLVRNITKGDYFLGDVIEVKTTLKKVGFLDISNISFRDAFSDDFKVESLSSCALEGNSIVWKGNLNKAGDIFCTYRLTPVRPVVFKNSAVLSYSLLGKPQERYSNHTFNVSESPIWINLSSRNSTLKLDQVFYGNVTIRALKDFSLRRMNISFPDKLNILNYTGGLEKKQSVLTYSNEFAAGNLKNVSFSASSKYAAAYKINMSMEYSYGNRIRVITKEFILNVSPELFYLDLTNNSNSSILRVSNPKDIVFKEIYVSVGNESFHIPVLDAKRFKEFVFPLGDKKVRINLSFESAYGQRFFGDYVLAYGESTNPKYEKEKLTEQKDPVIQKEEIKKKNKITIDPKIISLVFLIASISIVAIFLVNFIRSRLRKSDLDREIDNIKKEALDLSKK